MTARRVSGRAAALVLLATAIMAGLIGLGVRALLQQGGTPAPTVTPQVQAVSATVPPATPTPLAPLILSTATPAITSAVPTSSPTIGITPSIIPTATAITFDPERLYAVVSPAVVTISNMQKPRPGATTLREANFGSGVIFDPRGYIITNRHVIDGADAIEISVQGGQPVPGTLVGYDKVIDIAVVKIDAAAVTAIATLGDSALVRAGQHVVAIGTPHQFGVSVTRGVISGTDRTVGGVDSMLQTDAPTSPGNSGGPLVNAGGEVVGIVTSYVHTNQAERIAFAIPINTAKQLAGMIVADGKVVRTYIGVTTELLTPARAEELNVKAPRGAYVSEVSPNTPGAQVGLRKGDVILTVNRAPVDRAHPLPLVLLDFKPGETVTLTINRDGIEQQIPVTLIERPADIDP